MAISVDLLRQPVIDVVAAPLFGAILVLIVGSFLPRIAGWLAIAVTGLTLVIGIVLLGQASTRPDSFANPLPWPVSPAPPTFLANVDGTALVVLVAGLALCLLIWSCAPERRRDLGTGYFALSLALLGTTIGLLLAADLLTFYVFWELSAIFAAFLLLTRFDEPAGAAATRFLSSSILLSSFAFFAIVWSGWGAGTFEFSPQHRSISSATPEARWMVGVALVALVLFRGAVFPFQVWMRQALRAAHLPAALLLFVLLQIAALSAMVRIILPHIPLQAGWGPAVAALGLLTALSGCAAALRPKNASEVFGYLCVGQGGFVMFGLGIGNAAGISGAAFHFFSFGVSTVLLGLVLRSYGSLLGGWSLERWREFAISRPWPFFAVAVALWGMAGLPPSSGYSARMLLVESLMTTRSTTRLIMLAGIVLAIALSLAAVARLAMEAKSEPGSAEQRRERGIRQLISWELSPAVLLGVVTVVLGLASSWLSSGFFARLAGSALNLPVRGTPGDVPPWAIAASAVVMYVSLAAGALIFAVRSDAEQINYFAPFAASRRLARKFSLLAPVGRLYWRLADKGAFDVYPAMSSIVNGFGRVGAFLVRVSAGRGTR